MAPQGYWSEPSVAATFEDLMTHWRGLDGLSVQPVWNHRSKTGTAMRGPRHRDDNGSLPLTGREHLAMELPRELENMVGPLGNSSCFNKSEVPSSSNWKCDDDTAHEPSKLYGNQIERLGMKIKNDDRVWQVIQKEVMDWYESDTMGTMRRSEMVCFDTHFLSILKAQVGTSD